MKIGTVQNVAKLAQISVTSQEAEELSHAFVDTLKVVSRLNELDTKNVHPTHNMSGVTNVFRDDLVTPKRMLTQKQALQNAKSMHNGFFVVDQVIESE